MHVTEAGYTIIWHMQHIDANIRSKKLDPAAFQSPGEAKCNRKKTYVHPMVKSMCMFPMHYCGSVQLKIEHGSEKTYVHPMVESMYMFSVRYWGTVWLKKAG